MKFNIKLRAGAETSEHRLEVRFAAIEGQAEFSLQGDARWRTVDWAEVAPGVYSILLDGRSYEASIAASAEAARAREFSVTVGTRQYAVELEDPRERRHGGLAGAHQGPQEILAPMPGKIVKVLVEENQPVAAGDGLVVIEAMKMQNELRAPRAGRVEKVYVGTGVGVETGTKLVRVVS